VLFYCLIQFGLGVTVWQKTGGNMDIAEENDFSLAFSFGGNTHFSRMWQSKAGEGRF